MDPLTIIVPAYNEEECIAQVIDEIESLSLSFHLIVVNDSSTDGTVSKIKEKMKQFGELNESGQTILLVTHEHDIAEHAKRQVHLKDGLIERDFLNEVRRGQHVESTT